MLHSMTDSVFRSMPMAESQGRGKELWSSYMQHTSSPPPAVRPQRRFRPLRLRPRCSRNRAPPPSVPHPQPALASTLAPSSRRRRRAGVPCAAQRACACVVCVRTFDRVLRAPLSSLLSPGSIATPFYVCQFSKPFPKKKHPSQTRPKHALLHSVSCRHVFFRR